MITIQELSSTNNIENDDFFIKAAATDSKTEKIRFDTFSNIIYDKMLINQNSTFELFEYDKDNMLADNTTTKSYTATKKCYVIYFICYDLDGVDQLKLEFINEKNEVINYIEVGPSEDIGQSQKVSIWVNGIVPLDKDIGIRFKSMSNKKFLKEKLNSLNYLIISPNS